MFDFDRTRATFAMVGQLQFKVAPLGGGRARARYVVERVKTQTSLMPENFVDTVTAEELYHLLAFLVSQRAK